MLACMPGPSPAAKKLRIDERSVIWLRGDVELLGALPHGATITRRGSTRTTHAVFFVTTRADVDEVAALGALPPITWLAYPKKTSGMPTDLTRDEGWNALFDAGYVGIGSIAIDATWSGLRVRPGTDAEQAKVAQLRASMRRAGERRTAKKPPAKAPADLSRALRDDATATATFATLAPSHVREYVEWIENAKKPETRTRRIAETVRLLARGVRDRSARYR
jgi:hypothetical protein